MIERQVVIVEKLLLVLVIVLAIIVTLLIGKNGLVGGALSMLAGIVCIGTYLTHRQGDREERQMASIIGVLGIILGPILGPLTMIYF